MNRPLNRANRYLWFRRESAVIWFRMAVPKKFQSAVGQPIIAESLSTSDVREARIKAGKRRAELLEEWVATHAASLGPDGASPHLADPTELAVRLGYDRMLADMNAARRLWPDDDAGYAAKIESRQADLRRWSRSLQEGDLSRWQRHAERFAASNGLDLEPGTAEHGEFVRSFAEASVDAVGVFVRQTVGELDAAPRTAIVREAKAKAAKAEPGETLLEQFERWAAERLAKKGKRPDTVNQDRKKIERFAAFVGVDRAVDSITPEEVFAYRETMRDLPPKWAANKAFKGLSMREAAARARELDMPNMAYTTINQHLSTISPLYKWLAKQPRWAGLRNPCDGLFHDDVKGKNPRPPLNTAALNKLLTSPLFTGFLADGQEHLPGKVQADDWRKWVLLGTMFTGARIGEIAQLRVCDVREDRGVWLVNIFEEEAAGLTVKNRKGHLVPVHTKLIALGFLAFVERQRAVRDDDAPLFAGIERGPRGYFDKVSRWYRDYFKAIGVKRGKDGVGPHSFRHTLTDRLRGEAELLDNQIAVILDHSAKTTTGGYGRDRQGTVRMLAEWMEAVTWDGVRFDHLTTRSTLSE